MLQYNATLEFQARMRPTPGTMATQFSSFAIGYTSGSRVEVLLKCLRHKKGLSLPPSPSSPSLPSLPPSSLPPSSLPSLLPQINCYNPDPFCSTWYNGTDISDQLTAVNDSFSSSDDLIEVVREGNNTVTVVMGLGVSLAVTYNSSVQIPSFQLNLDPNLTGTMMGLLGSRDGDPSNDLIYRNGTQLDMDSVTDGDIFDFGNSCEQ